MDGSTLRVKLRGGKIGDGAVHVHDDMRMECDEVINAVTQNRSSCARMRTPGASVENR